ncbi:MAG: aquaporin [Vicinamibacterales bacterium]
MTTSLTRRLAAEGVGTALLLAAVVGSGIMAEQLAGGNVAVALLANTIATVATLAALITVLGPVSGAQFNPAVTAWAALTGRLAWRDAPGYVTAQVAGAIAGVLLAHAMFDVPLVGASTHARAGAAQLISEATATFGLLLVIAGAVRHRPDATAGVVAAFIAGAYWFTASTCFANPAVTVARSFTDTFAGIRPADVAGFIGAQVVGVALAVPFTAWLFPRASESTR